jgi:hypothetical protein
MNEHFSAFSVFIARFHVLLIHLPIGSIVLLACLEALALAPRFRHLASSSTVILGLTLLAAAATAGTGWLLGRGEGYDPDLLAWHRWTGVSVVAAISVLLALHLGGWAKAYRIGLVLTLGLVAFTGHFGGSLTHGREFLTKFAPWHSAEHDDPPATQAVSTNLLTQPIYAAVVQPLFNKYCVSCHGPQKSKAKLRLDSYDALVKGSENGPVMDPGMGAACLLIKRLHLPPEDEDHMPPDGKRQPTPQEIALLQWWIDRGAPTNQTAAELNPPSELQHLFSSGIH